MFRGLFASYLEGEIRWPAKLLGSMITSLVSVFVIRMRDQRDQTREIDELDAIGRSNR